MMLTCVNCRSLGHAGDSNDQWAASQSKRAREREEWEAIHGIAQAERKHVIGVIQPKRAAIPLRLNSRCGRRHEFEMANLCRI
jgi:hypothetical protein